MAEKIYVLAELTSLEDLNVPLNRSARLRYTSLSVSRKYIALGSNTGGVYIFSRDSLKYLQVVFGELESTTILQVSLSPSSDNHVAFATSSGQVIVMEMNIEKRQKPERIRLTSDHAGSTITSLQWNMNGNRLYIGDNGGKVTVAHVPISKASVLFNLPSEVIAQLDSAVVQMDFMEDKLLVSTMTRCYLFCTIRQKYSQIGKKLREGEYGACFFVEPSSKIPVLYCSRPGSRMWEVDIQGNVLNTHQFKQLLAIPSAPIVKYSNVVVSSVSDVAVSQSINMKKMYRFSNFILTWSSSGLYIFDTVNVKVVLWCCDVKDIDCISIYGHEIYIFHEDQSIVHLHMMTLETCLSHLVSRHQSILAGNVLLYYSQLYQDYIKNTVQEHLFQSICDCASKSDKVMLDRLLEIKTLPNNNTALKPSVGQNNSQCLTETSSKMDSQSNNPKVVSNQNHSSLNYSSESSDSLTKQQVLGGKDLEKCIDVSKNVTSKSVSCISSEPKTNDFHENTDSLVVTTVSDSKSGILNSSSALRENGDSVDIKNFSGEVQIMPENIGNNDMKINEHTKPLVLEDLVIDSQESTSVNDEDTSLSHIEKSAINIENKIDTSLVDKEIVKSDINESRNSHLPVVREMSNETTEGGDVDDDVVEDGIMSMITPSSSVEESNIFGANSPDNLTENHSRKKSEIEDSVKDQGGVLEVERLSKKSVRRRKTTEIDLVQPQSKGKSKSRNKNREKKKDMKSKRSMSVPAEVDESTSQSIKERDTVSVGSMEDVSNEEKSADNMSISSFDDLFTSSTKDEHIVPPLIKRLSLSGVVSSNEDLPRIDMSPSDNARVHSNGSPITVNNLSQSPIATLSAVKDSLALKIKKGKSLIKIMKDKSSLSKSPIVSDVGSADMETLTQSLSSSIEKEVETTKDLNTKTTVPIPVKKIPTTDIRNLETMTAVTKEQLQDVRVMLNPDQTRKFLTDWVVVLNQTLQNLYTSLMWKNKAEAASENSEIMNCENEHSENDDIISDKPNTHSGTGEENEQTSESVKDNKVSQTNFYKKFSMVCNTSDPFNLETELFNHVAEFILLCFHSCIHGNISKYVLHLPNCDQTVRSMATLDSTQTETTKGLIDVSNSESHDQRIFNNNPDNTHYMSSSTTLENNVSVGINDNLGSDVTDIRSMVPEHNAVNENECNNSLNHIIDNDDAVMNHIENRNDLCTEDIHGNDQVSPNMNGFNDCDEKDAQSDIAIKEMDTGDKSLQAHNPSTDEEGLENFDTEEVDKETLDKEIAQFVRYYFCFLSVSEIQKFLLNQSDVWYQTWLALVECCQDLGKVDPIRDLLERQDVNDALDHLRSGILKNKDAFLGHFASIFSISPYKCIEFARDLPNHVSSYDIMNLCSLHGKPPQQFLLKYVLLRYNHSPEYMRSQTLQSLCEHPCVKLEILKCLLSRSEQNERNHSRPSAGSHLHKWTHKLMIQQVLDFIANTDEESSAINICRQNGYWLGYLLLLKKRRKWKELLETICHLGDVELLSSKSPIGFVPKTEEEWIYLLETFKSMELDEKAETTVAVPNFVVSMTWENLACLLVDNLGSQRAISILLDLDLQDGTLSNDFYQKCILKAISQQQQSYVMHNMLEKINTYLWSKKPTQMAPQLHYAVSSEKLSQSSNSQADVTSYQKNFSRLSSSETTVRAGLEDAECHWGIMVDMKKDCPCCGQKLTVTVSHNEPGVFIFDCGHAFHKFCVMKQECPLC